MPKHNHPPFIMGTIAYKCPNCNNHTFVMIEYTDMNYRPSRLRRFWECSKCGVHYYLPKTTTKMLKPADRLKKSAPYFTVKRAFAKDRRIDVQKWNAVFKKMDDDVKNHIHCDTPMVHGESRLRQNHTSWICPKCGYEDIEIKKVNKQ